MNPKILFGSIAGVAVVLVGVGGVWVILNFETVAARALELGIKLAVKRGVQLSPETVRLLLELGGGAAGATAGAAGQAAGAAGEPPEMPAKREAGPAGKSPRRPGPLASGPAAGVPA